MKLIRNILPLLATLIILSCGTKHEEINKKMAEKATPAAFDNNKLSISSRSQNNIIDKLFDEAKEKDKKLVHLLEEIDNMDNIKYDNLKSYREYSSTMGNYWVKANEFISQIHDSTLRADLNKYFDTLKSDYHQSMTKYDLAVKNVDRKEIEMKDFELVMKLFITKPMMEHYMKNELPGIEPINALANKYDSLIRATKNYSPKNK